MAKEKKMDASEIISTLISEGFDTTNVEVAVGMMPGQEIDSLRLFLKMMETTEKAKGEKKEKENKEKKLKKLGREKDIEAALVRICGSNVPECYNSIRNEKRFSAPRKNVKIPEGRERVVAEKENKEKNIKVGDILKVHDRDLFGIRFTDSTGINFTFQAELPFERRGKLDLTDSEHATRKEEILRKIHSVLMGAMTEKGEFLEV
jgi:hypothetical protein